MTNFVYEPRLLPALKKLSDQTFLISQPKRIKQNIRFGYSKEPFPRESSFVHLRLVREKKNICMGMKLS